MATKTPLQGLPGERAQTTTLNPSSRERVKNLAVASRSAVYHPDLRMETLVASVKGIALLKQEGFTFHASMVELNGTRFGDFVLDTAEDFYGPIADYDGDERAEIFISSPWGIAVIKPAGAEAAGEMAKPNGTSFGGWILNTRNDSFGPAADFDGDGSAEILVASPWGIAILKRNQPWGIGIMARPGNTMVPLMMAQNGTKFGEWVLDTAEDDFSSVGNFSGNGKAEILVSGPLGVGLLELDVDGQTLKLLKMVPNGTHIGGWLLNTTDTRLGPIGDFNGDGKAEILLTSPSGIAVLAFTAGEFSVSTLQTNGAHFDNWTLDTATDHFGPCGDFDGDKKDEILVTGASGIAILKVAGDTMTALAMVPNGKFLGGGSWVLDTTNTSFRGAADYDGDGKAELLVQSGVGIGILKVEGDTMELTALSKNGRLVATDELVNVPTKKGDTRFTTEDGFTVET